MAIVWKIQADVVFSFPREGKSKVDITYIILMSSSHFPKKFVLFAWLKALLKWWEMLFGFILKILFVLKIFKFLSRLLVHVEKTAWLER